jgi:hypothetical protein
MSRVFISLMIVTAMVGSTSCRSARPTDDDVLAATFPNAKYRKYLTVLVNAELGKERAVLLIGEVRNPGPYRLSAAGNLAQLIASAGGFTDMAVENKFEVIRADATFVVPLREELANPSFKLEPADLVVVGTAHCADLHEMATGQKPARPVSPLRHLVPKAHP